MQGELKEQEGREAPWGEPHSFRFLRALQTHGPGKKFLAQSSNPTWLEAKVGVRAAKVARTGGAKSQREGNLRGVSLKCCSTVSWTCLPILTHTHRVRPRKPSKQQQLGAFSSSWCWGDSGWSLKPPRWSGPDKHPGFSVENPKRLCARKKGRHWNQP